MAGSTTKARSGNVLIDALLLVEDDEQRVVYLWDDTDLKYQFPRTPAQYIVDNPFYGGIAGIAAFRGFDDSNKDTARLAMGQFDGASGLQLEETAFYQISADIRYGKIGFTGTAPAFGIPPLESVENILGTTFLGDVWLNSFDDDLRDTTPGSFGHYTILHEAGHAVGLKHAHEEGLFGERGEVPDWVEDVVDVAGPDLPDNWDRLYYTVMTYEGISRDTDYPQSIMMLDIQAVQYLYGADFTYNSGNTTYKWDPDTGTTYVNGSAYIAPEENKILMTIWDGGGIDTYDFSDYRYGVVVDLSPGSWTRTTLNQRAWHEDHFAPGNIANALLHNGDTRSLIENAIGGLGNDRLFGNEAPNNLQGRGGNDFINGYGGNDTLYGGSGSDTLYGATGNDYLIGGGDRDQLWGLEGNDWMNGQGGDDTLYGYSGSDTLVGGTGNDTLFGGTQNDQLWGYEGNDSLNGEAGDDKLYGYFGNDTLVGESGDDTIYGGWGADHLWGWQGEDYLNGEQNDDLLYGYYGNDTLDGASGNDTLYGGWGSDRLFGRDGNDFLDGEQSNDRIWGNAGSDRMYGGSGLDSIYGGSGNDFLNGQSGADYLSSGSGNDTIYGATGNDTLFGGSGNDQLWGLEDNDYLSGNSGNDTLYGFDGDDTLFGSSGLDTLYGGRGEDKLYGGFSRDYLNGEQGNDTLDGGSSGQDELWGGTGRDEFVFRSSSGDWKRINDFDSGWDTINFASVWRSDGTYIANGSAADTNNDGWITRADTGWSDWGADGLVFYAQGTNLYIDIVDQTHAIRALDII